MKRTEEKINYYVTTEEICQKLNFPQDAKGCFLDVEKKIISIPELAEAFEKQVRFFVDDDSASMRTANEELLILSERFSINYLTLKFVYLLHCAPYTRKKYAERNLPDSLFWDGLADLNCKLKECREMEGVNGTTAECWYENFLRLNRFTLGRFQYEPFGIHTRDDLKLECGYVVKKNSRFVVLHIPGSGIPLTDEQRSKSYELAYDFFKDWAGGDTVLLHTDTWLLYPKASEFLPEKSNILKFMKDFDIYEWKEKENFSDAWRLFGRSATLPVEEWHEDNSLRCAYKNWIAGGNKSGSGRGFIVMHKGKNVTHIKDFFK